MPQFKIPNPLSSKFSFSVHLTKLIAANKKLKPFSRHKKKGGSKRWERERERERGVSDLL